MASLASGIYPRHACPDCRCGIPACACCGAPTGKHERDAIKYAYCRRCSDAGCYEVRRRCRRTRRAAA